MFCDNDNEHTYTMYISIFISRWLFTHINMDVYTSIAARGGGGSFKREKYIMQKNMWL